MFNQEKKTDLNKISLTGLRALVLIGLLVQKPRSIVEIRQAFIDYKILNEKSSNDILRIDLNTIKLMGCEISRPSAKTNYQYVLLKHPFDLKVSKEEIAVLKRIYNKIKEKADLNTLLAYDALFKKISGYICDEERKEQILGISILKYYDIEKIKDLIEDCKQRKTLEIMYKKTTSSQAEKRDVVAHKIELKNDKLYLYCFDLGKQESRVFNLRRLIAILSRRIENNDFKVKLTKIKFIVKNIDLNELEDSENVIDKTEKGFLVEAEYYNDFLAMQRVLSFGSNCIVLEPFDFKLKVIQKIKETRQAYGS